ncbi:hypothetical protein QUB63_25235 [Microcoleus sp. ARI1-B5]|uniref:hypothetical protein n=1 Tax=unclassified Microcoleus TaxID=2642155 RepID=UPI002FD30DD8
MKPLITIGLVALIGTIAFLIWQDSQNTEGIDRNLLQAVKGNKSLAKRLLANARDRYPGKSERWYAEKVIYDLERDGAGSGGRRGGYSINKRELRENIFLAGAVVWLISSVSSLIDGLFRR